MVAGGEHCQLRAAIEVLVPYTSGRQRETSIWPKANLRGRFAPSNTALRSGHLPEDPDKRADRSVPNGRALYSNLLVLAPAPAHSRPPRDRLGLLHRRHRVAAPAVRPEDAGDLASRFRNPNPLPLDGSDASKPGKSTSSEGAAAGLPNRSPWQRFHIVRWWCWSHRSSGGRGAPVALCDR
jgi:hypothetical protein